MRPLLLSAYLLAALGSFLALVALREEFSGLPLGEFFFETKPGSYGIVRLAASVAGLAGFLVGLRTRRSWLVPMIVAALGALTISGTSHAAAGDGYGWGWLLHFVHVAAALGWLGGVAGVAFVARSARSDGELDGELLRSFASVATFSVGALLGTGFLELFVHIRAADQLLETRYGGVLLLKVGLIAPLMAIAIVSARLVSPAAAAGRVGSAIRLTRWASLEVFLGITVLVAASALTEITTAASLPRDAPPGALEFGTTVDDVEFVLSVAPNRTGFNAFALERAESGSSIELQSASLSFTYLDDATVGPSTLELERSDSGGFVGSGPFLPLEGSWLVQAVTLSTAGEEARANFAVRPAGSLFVARDRRGAWHNPAATLPWNQFGGFLALMAGFGFLFLARRGAPRWQLVLRSGTMGGFLVGATLLFGVHVDEAPAGLVTNPVVADRNSVQSGQRIFESSCVVCHGREGVPPPGLDLNPYPLDLTVHVPLHPDGVLFGFVSNGVPGSAMRAWGEGDGALSEEQIWHLVNYLRTLRPAFE